MIRIVTDSGCDLPEDVITGNRIEVVPLTVCFGDDTYMDRVDLDIDGFWQKLTGGGVIPQTAAPSVGQFTSRFDELARAGADGIVVMCMSSAISATHRAAVLAAEGFGAVPVRIIDSRLVSGALGLAVMEAAQRAMAGDDLETVAAAAADACEATDLYATLDTLEYLKRGGRIGTAAAFVGGLLDVKPIISFEVGEVTAAGRVRTRRRALDNVLDHLRGINERVRRLGVIHSDAEELPEFLHDVTSIHGTEPLIIRIGPIVGTHAGPGVLGITYRLG
jgi:DegV family protein with EDD domain